VTELLNNTSLDISSLASAVAASALAQLPVSETLSADAPRRDAAGLNIDGQAVVARLSGSTNGELLIVVGRALVDALENSPLGSLDVTHALRPALEAAASAVGPVVVGPAPGQTAGAAIQALLAKPDAAIVTLRQGDQIHAVVGVSIDTAPTSGRSSRSTSSPSVMGLPGMDLLRGVEMDVTAELGRTRMTLNDLLGLTDGAVIELDRSAGAPADLLVNGRLIARGEVVVIDENFGLRITEIVSDIAAR
jgi:flagellar motor switch protein FliN/FliY